MVEQGRPMPVSLASTGYNQYPAPLAKYEDVVADRQLFMTTLEKLHTVMGTKFMIPIIGGRELDLHKLFVEVTSRGGIDKILREKRWKEVTATFNFPSTATNASFVLRKYYHSLLLHYERIYFFRVQGWNSTPTGTIQNSNFIASPVQGFPKLQPAAVPTPSQVQAVNTQQQRMNTIQFVSGAAATSPVGAPIVGVIDGKFESGYLVTVRYGKEILKGVLYQAPQAQANQVPQAYNFSTANADSPPTTSGRRKRKRRRKSELRKRDPSHPKPNRSGYNFFFAEQHARLKPLHPGKDRDISRMIGELWNNLDDTEKAVYQEKAVRDKERYRMEMEDYKEKLRGDQVISDAVPIQQRFPGLGVGMVEVDVKDGTERDSPETAEDESDDTSKSETEDDDQAYSDTETYPAMDIGNESGYAGIPETSAAAGDFQVVQEDDKAYESEVSLDVGGNVPGEAKQDSLAEQNSFAPMI